jgi:hypothetical protein
MDLSAHDRQLIRDTTERAMADVMPEQVAELRRQRDALRTICGKLARLKSGPPPNKRPEWICKVLDLAAEARYAIALCEQEKPR